MSPLSDLFSRQQPGAEAHRQVENWPPPPVIKPVPAGRSGITVFPNLSAGAQQRPDKYGPAIVIGLGKAGEIALRQWFDELAQDPAGPQKGLQVLLLTRYRPDPLPENLVSARILQLESSKAISSVSLRASQLAGLRGDSSLRFRQAANFHQFRGWLGDCLLSLRTQIRVFIVGSLAEPEIGVLGDLLQVLRIQPESPGKSSPYATVTALLSLEPAGAEQIPAPDVYAALREIARFTFSGPHIYDTAFGLNDRVRFDAAPLDHLFLLENKIGHWSQMAEATPYDRGLGQAFAEFLFTMTHPAARPLWQDLSDELNQDAGNLRRATRRVFVHSFGAATLYVPVAEIQAYIAARLSLAAIYGERTDTPEGLLARKAPQADQQAAAKLLARRWLLTGPCSHPFFEWFWNANGPGYFRVIPGLAPEMETAFQAQVAHGLTSLLNDPAGSDLELARQSLDALKFQLDQVEQWFKSAPATNPNVLERLTLQGFLNNGRAAVEHLASTLADWHRALQPSDASPRAALPSATATDWRKQVRPADAGTSAPMGHVGVWSVLDGARKSAEKELAERARDRIYRPVTADRVNDLAEAEKYYTDTIRPELSRYIKESNLNFNRVRERVEWWVSLVPGRLPELLLLCWPVDYAVTPGTEPSSEACFTPGSAPAFAQSLLRVSRAQVQGRAEELAGTWFESRILPTVEFLRRAENAYLEFDEDLALSCSSVARAASRNSYLLAHDLPVSQKHLNDVFPTAFLSTRNPLGEGERTRLTAITYRLNIPLEAIQSCNLLAGEYHPKSLPNLHIYRQEANATVYEKRYWDEKRERFLLPADCVVALFDQPLVTLFCQALIVGCISNRRDANDQNQQWIVDAPTVEKLPPLPLKTPDLWTAFKNFVLEFPCDPRLNEDPNSPFRPDKREKYVAAFHAAVLEQMHQADIQDRRKQFARTILAEIQAAGEKDLLARAFACVLKAEFDEPVWKGW